MADETASLRIDVDGTEQFQSAAAAASALEAEFQQLADVVNRGAPGWELAKKRLVDVTQELNAARQASQSLSVATLTTGPNAFSGQMENASKAAQQYARSLAATSSSNKGLRVDLMQVGYALDDLQYGFRGFANNIPGLLIGLGAGAGLAGGITTVVMGANLLYNQWDNLTELMGGTAIRTAAEEMKHLADMTERTNEQTNRLRELQANAQQNKADETGIIQALTTRSEADTRAGQQFSEALRKSLNAGEDGTDFAAALTERVIQRQLEVSPGTPVDANAARSAVEERIGKAQAGDQDALNFIRDYARGQGGILGRFSEESTKLADEQEEREEQDRTKPARDAAMLSSTNRRKDIERDLSAVSSADEFVLVMNRINQAIRDSAVSDEDAAALLERAAEIRRRATDAEAENVARIAQINRDKETDTLNAQGAANEAAFAPEIEEARRANARRESREEARLASAAEGYGQAYAGRLSMRMMAGQQRGEDAGEVDRSLIQQVAARMTGSGLNDEQRMEAASRIVQGRRENMEDYQMQRQMQAGIQREQFIANMAPAGTTLGVMQRQMLARADRAAQGPQPGSMADVIQRQMMARQGIDPDAVARMGTMAAGQPKAGGPETKEQKQEKATDKFASAVDKMERVMSNIQVIM